MEKPLLQEVLPKHGMLYEEDVLNSLLCKPKILSLKSVTLEKLEKMQQVAENQVRLNQVFESRDSSDSKSSFTSSEGINRLVL